jgi:2,3-bisphosphoglycerate-independent phosphoglycerate mutase
MKAREITKAACEAIVSGRYEHVRLNLANGDMVGHTGDLPATIYGVEVVDECLGLLEEATRQAGGCLVVTADHGNAEEMYQLDRKKGIYKRKSDGAFEASTSHSINPVPFVLMDAQDRWSIVDLQGASIANLGPTLIQLAGFVPPEGMLPGLVFPKGSE